MNDGISWREDFGCYWPDYDHAPEKCFALVKRNLTDMDIAVRLCVHHRVCVQAGAHAGLWPKRLGTIFDTVYAFEPEEPLYRCAALNIGEVSNIFLERMALGASVRPAKIARRSSAGSSVISETEGAEIGMTTIDALDLPCCDAIFLDIEGYELEALRGGVETIERFSPVIHVEELPHARDAIQAHLASIGYRFHMAVHKDRIYVR